MGDDTLTHKDLAVLLGVSETTVKSYRRKFPAFIPVRFRGKPIRFAPRAADVCLRIREGFVQGLSVEEVRRRLQREFPDLAGQAQAQERDAPRADHAAPGGQAPPPDLGPLLEAVRDLAGLQAQANQRLEKLQEALGDFLSLHLAREDVFGRGVGELRRAWEEQARGLGQSMEQAVARVLDQASAVQPPGPPEPEVRRRRVVTVRNAFGGKSRYVLETSEEPEGGEAAEPVPAPGPAHAAEEPPRALLELPLVVRFDKGEFVGVAGRSMGAFSLQDLEELLRGADPHYALSWSREDGAWRLAAELQARPGERYRLDLVRATTPKGNDVALLKTLYTDGREVPPANLYALIKRLRQPGG
jgi:hypothetical protein